MKREKPLWKIPVLWLVVALPLASIVAGVGLVVVALRTGDTDPVTDKVQRVSQIQVTDLGPDGQAQRQKLSAVVRIGEGDLELIPVSGEFSREEPLRLSLAHPVQARQDRSYLLSPAPSGWRAEGVEIEDGHDWILQLAPEDGRWRLRGRLPMHQRAARLAPSLPAE